MIARPRIDHLFIKTAEAESQPIKLHYGDLNDLSAMVRIIDKTKPDHIVNLGAQSHVAVSFEVPIETSLVTGVGAAALFEGVRIVNKDIRIYQASSSEMFGGGAGNTKLNENSLFVPKSPYAASKVYSFHMANIYRDSYGMHITNGILFNHESPRRGENFVSRKISLAVANIKKNRQEKLHLGNLEATRDWGHARDYMRAVRMMLDSESPDDYVVATGVGHSVRDFAKQAFGLADLDFEKHVVIDQALFRPNEVHNLLGDPSKIKNCLGWSPEVNFEELVREMVESDLSNV